MGTASETAAWLPPEVPDGVDRAKAEAIISWLVDLEGENDKTRKATDSEIIQRVAKRIQSDVRCS